MVVLLVCWGVFVAFQLLQSHWGHCSTPYWAIYSVQAALCLVAECIFVALVRASHAQHLSKLTGKLSKGTSLEP